MLLRFRYHPIPERRELLSDNPHPKNNLKKGKAMNVIETRKLTKYYGSFKGIEDLDLSVEQGDFFGFIGPNGAGKSTCIRTLLGLIQPTGGSASVLGHDIVTGHNEILASVGYLPSEINFYAGMKVRDTIRYSASLRKKDCSKAAAEYIERLGLDTEKRVDHLSLGNRKKAGIICAIQHQPELLIMDEPTSGLDPLMQKVFFDILKELNEKGTTIFLSSHILSEVQAHCRTAAFIKDGRIIISDKVEKMEEAGAKKIILKGVLSEKLLQELRRMEETGKKRGKGSKETQGTGSGENRGDSFGENRGTSADSITDLKIGEGNTAFLYNGDMSRLLKLLAEEKPRDVSITEPTLEEIFMNYYE